MVHTRSRRARGIQALALVTALGLGLAACGGDDDDGEAEEEPTDEPSDTTEAPAEDEELTASDTGITEDTVKLGIPLVDYDAIAFAVDFNRGDQEAGYQTLIDWMNEEMDGIGGRQIEAVYELYPPIPKTTSGRNAFKRDRA